MTDSASKFSPRTASRTAGEVTATDESSPEENAVEVNGPTDHAADEEWAKANWENLGWEGDNWNENVEAEWTEEKVDNCRRVHGTADMRNFNYDVIVDFVNQGNYIYIYFTQSAP